MQGGKATGRFQQESRQIWPPCLLPGMPEGLSRRKEGKVSELRRSARSKDCTVRLPGVCNFNPETTVLAHLRMAGITGGSLKAKDMHGAFACSSCHDQIDGRTKRVFDLEYLKNAFYDGMVRTQAYWLQNGYITIK
jgi:hypothetical protein